HFFSAYAYQQRVKCPVEYVVGAARAVYRPYDEREESHRPLLHHALVRWIDAMGQSLFAPPSVKGWPGGPTWLNTATMLERDNFAAALAMGTLWTDFSPEPTASKEESAPSANAVGKTSRPASPPEIFEEFPPPRAFDPARLLDEDKVSRPEDVVRLLLD